MPDVAMGSSGAGCESGVDALSLEEAWVRIETLFPCVASAVEVPLLDALDRVLADPLVSQIDLPPFANSAMDGYAFAFASLEESKSGRLRLAKERLAAGVAADVSLGGGDAVRIFTGAALPDGVDTVAMQEQCVREDGFVTVPTSIRRGENCRPAGGDVARGERVLEKGVRLRPQDLALAAAMGHECLSVYRPLRVAVLSTGDELCEPGMPLSMGGIYDSNRYGVLSLLEWLGCTVVDLGIVRDDPKEIVSALRRAVEVSDAILTTGGMSVGEEDHVKGAISALGELAFWRINIKPGKPVGIARVLGTPLIGLPGNPVSALVTFMLIARPALFRLAGCTHTVPVSFFVESAFDHDCRGKRREFLRGRLSRSRSGRTQVEKFRTESSGVLSSLVETDGLIDLGGLDEVKVGQLVPFLPFGLLR